MDERVKTSPDDRYIREMEALTTICLLLDHVDIDWLIETIDYSEAVAPILHPEQYRSGAKNLQDQRRLLAEAKRLKDAVAEIRAEAPEQ